MSDVLNPLKKCNVVIFILFWQLAIGITCARAEGELAPGTGGIFGANRRVLTNGNGYSGVQGIFYLSNRRANEHFFIPVNNTANSKPSFYLGSSQGGDEIDAGVQYEWEQFGATPPGWAAFINYNTQFRPARQANGSHWRLNPTGTNRAFSFNLTHRILNDGSVNLSVHVAGVQNRLNFFWNTDQAQVATAGTPIFSNAQRAGIGVKRVVAITQGGSFANGTAATLRNGRSRRFFDLDGSTMDGPLFTEGKVATNRGADGNPVFPANPNWQANMIDQGDTGYLPGPSQQRSTRGYPDGRNGQDRGNPPEYIVHFPDLGAQRNQASAGRYSRENVHINLRRGGTIRGRRVGATGRTIIRRRS